MKREIQAETIIKDGKLTAIASTEDKDRSGDVLLVKNWDFTKFLKNPVLQAGHDYRPQYTIGKATNLRVENNQVLFNPVFHEITPLAKQVKKMYEEGFLNAWSVGFIPGERQIKGTNDGTLNELLEVSAVAVPANAFALMKGFETEENELETEIKEFISNEITKKEIEVEEKVAENKKTGETNGHVHMATYDSDTGEGSTDEAEGHAHKIENFEVIEMDGHTHSLSEEAEVQKENFEEAKQKEVTRWNKDLPNVFNKEFDIQSIDNIRMSFQNEIFTKFFGCDVKNLFVNNYKIPSPLVGTYLSAFKETTKEFELADTRNWHGNFEYPPLYEVIKLNSTKSEEFLLEGIQFFKVAGKNQVALKFDVGWNGVQVSLITNNENREWNKEFLSRVQKWASENNYLKGEKFALSGEFIPKTEKTWDEVVLDKKIKNVVQKTIEKVSSSESKSRGMLMIGPPGTGKTLTGKIMKDVSESTFIWVSAQDMYYTGASWALTLAYDLARDLGPSILFLEDIDEWLKDGKAIDVLKTEMDGLLENKGLITVLTSNHPEQLPDALLDRPGRFHDILEFSLPTSEVRKEMLNVWVGDLISEEKVNQFVEKTNGYSGAYIKELVEYAKAISEDEDISMEDALLMSIEKIQEQKELVQSIRQEHKSFDTIEIKEGRIISKSNRKKLEEARDAIIAVLSIEERSTAIEEEEGKGLSTFIPEKKEQKAFVSKKPDITLMTLQRIAGIANEGLHKSKTDR